MDRRRGIVWLVTLIDHVAISPERMATNPHAAPLAVDGAAA
jgi:hypothetical protein